MKLICKTYGLTPMLILENFKNCVDSMELVFDGENLEIYHDDEDFLIALMEFLNANDTEECFLIKNKEVVQYTKEQIEELAIDVIETGNKYETQLKYENSSKYYYKEFCACCGRGIKGEPKFWINTIEPYKMIPFNITDSQILETGINPMGLFPIGSECKKKYPKEYVGQ